MEECVLKMQYFCFSELETNAICNKGHHGHDCMVVGFTTTYAISAYHH
jgi:hypothetical protein